jgi:hypothetical protein
LPNSSRFAQPLIKLKLHLDSYLDLKSIYLSKYIVTDQAIYNFSGDAVYNSHQKYVFHYIDDRMLVRENFFTQKIELVDIKSNKLTSYNSYNDRLILRVHVSTNYIIVNYEDELLQFIRRRDGESFSTFTKHRIRAMGVDDNMVILSLIDNTVQVIELKN